MASDADTFRRNYGKPSEEQKKLADDIKAKAEELLMLYVEAGESRRISIAKTKLEESVMWAVKHVMTTEGQD